LTKKKKHCPTVIGYEDSSFFTTRIFKTQSAVTAHLSTAGDIDRSVPTYMSTRGRGVGVQLTGTGSVVGGAEF